MKGFSPLEGEQPEYGLRGKLKSLQFQKSLKLPGMLALLCRGTQGDFN